MEEEISYSYKEFAEILQKKGVLQQEQFKKKVVNKYQKIVEATLCKKLVWNWNGDDAVIKVRFAFIILGISRFIFAAKCFRKKRKI